MSFCRRYFELIEEKPVSEPIALGDDLVDHTSLTYDFDYQKDFREPVDLKKPHYLYHLTGRKVPISVVSTLTSLTNTTSFENDMHYTEYLFFFFVLRNNGSINLLNIIRWTM